MREILFRGKQLEGGKWLEGYLTYRYRYDQQSKKEILAPVIDTPHKFTFGNATGIVIESINVISGTEGQFTGLTDKNGKKIFDGDIFLVRGMETWVNGQYIVEFSTENHCWWLRNPNPRGCSFSFSDLNGFYEDGEVVGNVYDNPELWEVSE